MKVAISSQGKEDIDQVSEVFGRCPYFIVFDINSGIAENRIVMENTSMNQAGAAGTATAQMMAEKDINFVIAGTIGPRAIEVLAQFDIQTLKASGTISQAIEDFTTNKLEKIS